MKIFIYKETPKKQEKPNYAPLLDQLMNEMKEGEVAQINKKDWLIKTDPRSLWEARNLYKKDKSYAFSLRQDKNSFFLMKVKYPIDEYNHTLKKYIRRNDWANPKITLEIVKKKTS